MIEFRVLGPLEASADGHPIPLGGRQQRAVLAMLLLHANELVPADQLIDLVWGERPPQTAATVVQVYVSRLRKLLGHELLDTRAPGYVLKITPEQTDVGRATRLIAASRETLEPGTRSRLLRDALALWRGAALADFTYDDLARVEVERLEELRLTALESAIEAELELGMHAELVGELRALVETQPLRERPRAQLMLALYRAGRQADALSVYRDGRSELVQALGLEPGPSLRRLERQILAHDPGLDFSRPPERLGRDDARKLLSALHVEVVALDGEVEQALDPEDAKRLFEPLFMRIRAELERFGGHVGRFVGDSAIAVFGAPAAYEDHGERAVRAALAVRDMTAEHGEGRIGIRVGISTGDALVSAGGEPLGSGSAFGAVFTRADRVRSAAPANVVAVAEPTYRATRETVAYRQLETGQRFRMWEALATKTPIRGGRAPAREVALVGRIEELTTAEQSLRRGIEMAAGELVTIVGAPGIGKTRLLRELAARLTPGALWLQGRSVPYGGGGAYLAFAEAVKGYAGILDTDASNDVAEKIRDVVDQIAPVAPKAVENQLRVLLGLEAAQVASDRAEAFAGWRRFLEGVAAAQPVVLAFEDLHWADDGLLDFVDHLATSCQGMPLVLVCTGRPELLKRRAEWTAAASPAAIVELSPLSDHETRTLVGALLEQDSVQAGVEDWVVSRVGGNPLFAEEYVRAIADGGLRRQTGSGSLPQAMPESVHNIIAARLDALPPDLKALLEDAAIIGNAFWSGAVAAIGGRNRVGCEAQLEQVVGGDFVRHDAGSALRDEAQYTFKHALIRDVAYAQISRSDRSAKHKRAAEWIELHVRGDDSAELLAHHYVSALELAGAGGVVQRDLARRAVEVLWRAGARARRLYANDEAAAYFRKAWSLLDTVPGDDVGWRTELEVAIQESLGDVLELSGNHVDGEEAFAIALRLVPANDGTRRGRLFRKLGLSRQIQRRVDEAYEAFVAAEQALGEDPLGVGWWHERCELAVQRLQVLYFTAPLEKFAREAERARPLVDTHGTPAQRSALLTWRGNVALRRDRYVPGEQALAHHRAALTAARETENLSQITFAQFAYGFCLLWASRLDQAETEMRAALTLAERAGDATMTVRCLNYLGVVERKRGHANEAQTLADRTLEIAQRTQMLEYVAQARATLSWTAWHSGDHDRAAELARAAWTDWDDFFNIRVVAWMPLWPLLNVALAKDADAEAVEHARTILDPTRQPMPHKLKSRLAQAATAWDRGDTRFARTLLERASALATRDGYA
ncbi:MAG TPA: BTAD domain-containing putative transcriptional regulator [Solirubrobacteraceae bacterium]|nr:BTAD domain-containing putative transcriptional regulator [Solirubrobacteraceae bacterium]